MLVLRFSNGWFEPLWNRIIDYVEITGAESIGVEERGGYYDGSGAMRDMFQTICCKYSRWWQWSRQRLLMRIQCVMK